MGDEVKAKSESKPKMYKLYFLEILSGVEAPNDFKGDITFQKSYDSKTDDIQWTFDNDKLEAKIKLVDDNEYNKGDFCFEMTYYLKEHRASMTFTLNHKLLPQSNKRFTT